MGPLITGFFKSLEAYDQLLYGALRIKTPPKPEDVEAKVQDLYTAFDKLLATVPPEILQQANRVLEVAAAKAAEVSVVSSQSEAGSAVAGALRGVDDEAADLVMLLR